MMKKYFFACTIVAVLMSCNNGTNSGTSDGTKTNSSATDSTQTPNGMSNGSVISVDTAATRIDSSSHK